MLAFVRGEHDCLVTTTIIESGLDIPTANTLIVERADQLGPRAGLPDPRPGRAAAASAPTPTCSTPRRRRSPPTPPPGLATLSDNTELGSGFRVAMRDLEIRGAGNLLGDEQSGHVAAVGFELYCQMLEDAAEELRAERGGATWARRARAGAGRRRRGRLRARRLHPLRGGEDRHSPPGRRRPRARRAAGAARGARGPLRARPRAGGEPARRCSGCGSSSATPGPARSSSRRAACGWRRSSSTPRQAAGAARASRRRRSTSGASGRSRCRSPTSRGPAWPR